MLGSLAGMLQERVGAELLVRILFLVATETALRCMHADLSRGTRRRNIIAFFGGVTGAGGIYIRALFSRCIVHTLGAGPRTG